MTTFFRPALSALIIALAALLVAAPAQAAPNAAPGASPAAKATPGQRKPARTRQTVRRVPKGIGFLPGYRTPEQIERQEYEQTQRERRAYYRAGGPRIAYWRYPQPQFFRGRWNGGDFGACWKSTPIGYMWTCGR